MILIPVVRHIARQHVSRGWFMNMFEAMILFIRDEVARPAIGGHGADALPAVPLDGLLLRPVQQPAGHDPRHGLGHGNINVTAVLAMMTLVTVVMAGMREMGSVGFWVGIVPAHGRARAAQAAPLGPDVRHRGGRAC